MTLLLADPAQAGDAVRLAASHCPSCDRVEFPRREVCPACGAASDAIELSSQGTLTGFSAVLYAPPGALVEAPYWVGVVEFDGAIRVMGLVEPGTDESALELGLAVTTVAFEINADFTTYAYRL